MKKYYLTYKRRGKQWQKITIYAYSLFEAMCKLNYIYDPTFHRCNLHYNPNTDRYEGSYGMQIKQVPYYI